jgi:hypothetical protein
LGSEHIPDAQVAPKQGEIGGHFGAFEPELMTWFAGISGDLAERRSV